MSYCRFSEGDVYAYECEGGVQFWVAGGINQLDCLCNTYDSAYQYAKYLRDECGLEVPSHAIKALRLDALEEANHGDGSAVAELVAENAKLRKQINELKKLVWQYNSALNCLLKTGICTRQCVACWTFMNPAWLENRMRELGIEVGL